MNMAVCLLVYAVSLTVLGPGLLSRATRDGAAPRLGVCAWLAVMATVVAAWVGAVMLFFHQIVVSWGQIGSVLTGCLSGLGLIARGGYGDLLQVTFVILAVMGTVAVLVLAARAVSALHRSHRGGAEHIRAVRIAAGDTPRGPGGALVIDSDRRGVYCLAGRPHTIVMTRAALDVLDDAQQAAVISHERAHLIGHHHLVLAVTGAVSKILPRVRLFTAGAAEVARLLEMCADDAAARRHSADTVVDALLALILPSPTSSPPHAPLATPVAALGAAGLAVTQRIERLLFPPDRASARTGLILVMGAVLLGPALTAGLMSAPPVPCL
ncbi:peptidase M48 [Mycolicibacterium grossiae]|uniref:Peptidase M48 n=1 Tax=Mycolicibacterium grossiae TaxID=1552759 RepID=A0A1E8PXU8_9MYCO|nr:peptidase M48 [Mycolicibacterium grossiae]